jgi:hypothetical protein
LSGCCFKGFDATTPIKNVQQVSAIESLGILDEFKVKAFAFTLLHNFLLNAQPA